MIKQCGCEYDDNDPSCPPQLCNKHSMKPLTSLTPAEKPEHVLEKLLRESGIQIKFGLRAQGHIPTIERMLAEGCTWPQIGFAIGWCPETAKRWYYEIEKAG